MTEERNDSTCNYFLTSWNSEGVEAVVDITKDYVDEFDSAQAKLMGEPDPAKLPSNAGRMLHMMTLRARFQGNRFEIYGLLTDKTITEQDLRAWAESDPQGYVDMVRERGVSLYNTRSPRDDVIR